VNDPHVAVLVEVPEGVLSDERLGAGNAPGFGRQPGSARAPHRHQSRRCVCNSTGFRVHHAPGQMQSPFGMVITVRNGKIVRSMDYLSHEQTLEAVGLRD
jgi:hypothetical protein